jgi:hypothetical protein
LNTNISNDVKDVIREIAKKQEGVTFEVDGTKINIAQHEIDQGLQEEFHADLANGSLKEEHIAPKVKNTYTKLGIAGLVSNSKEVTREALHAVEQMAEVAANNFMELFNKHAKVAEIKQNMAAREVAKEELKNEYFNHATIKADLAQNTQALATLDANYVADSRANGQEPKRELMSSELEVREKEKGEEVASRLEESVVSDNTKSAETIESNIFSADELDEVEFDDPFADSNDNALDDNPSNNNDHNPRDDGDFPAPPGNPPDNSTPNSPPPVYVAPPVPSAPQEEINVSPVSPVPSAPPAEKQDMYQSYVQPPIYTEKAPTNTGAYPQPNVIDTPNVSPPKYVSNSPALAASAPSAAQTPSDNNQAKEENNLNQSQPQREVKSRSSTGLFLKKLNIPASALEAGIEESKRNRAQQIANEAKKSTQLNDNKIEQRNASQPAEPEDKGPKRRR